MAAVGPRRAGDERARWAWAVVRDARESLSKSELEELVSLARRLPSLLRTAGLGQTVAFIASKAKKDHALHLVKGFGAVLAPKERGAADVVSAVVKMTPEQYRMATRDMLERSVWLKRFAEAPWEDT